MPRSVLIIEDSPSTASLARLALSGLPCQVELARSAGEALRLVREMLPSVITLDAYLPGVSSIAFCIDLRSAAPAAAMVLLIERGMLPTDLPAAQVRLFKPLEPRRFAAVVGDLLESDDPAV